MRKFCLSILLPLALLLSQIGAAWHEVGHWSAHAAHGARQHDKQLADKVCELCLVFGQLASAAKPEPPLLQVSAAGFEQVAAQPVHVTAAQLPDRRSRGPPVFL